MPGERLCICPGADRRADLSTARTEPGAASSTQFRHAPLLPSRPGFSLRWARFPEPRKEPRGCGQSCRWVRRCRTAQPNRVGCARLPGPTSRCLAFHREHQAARSGRCAHRYRTSCAVLEFRFQPDVSICYLVTLTGGQSFLSPLHLIVYDAVQTMPSSQLRCLLVVVAGLPCGLSLSVTLFRAFTDIRGFHRASPLYATDKFDVFSFEEKVCVFVHPDTKQFCISVSSVR